MRNFYFKFILLICLAVSDANAVTRTWIGDGCGGTGTNFNAAANWSPAGAPSAADDIIIPFTVSCNTGVILTASVTVNSLTVTATSASYIICQIDVGTYVLTVTGAASFNSVNYTNASNYTDLFIYCGSSGAGFVFNGTTTIQTSTGQGDLLVWAATTSPGSMTFNGAYTSIGDYAYTSPGTEPNLIFNRSGAQTLMCKTAYTLGYHFKGESITFGTTNTPTVTIRGKGGAGFQPYDGNLTVAANSTVIVPDTNVLNCRTTLNSYLGYDATSSLAVTGTITMGAGSLIQTACPNRYSIFGYATHSLNATSTVHYFSQYWQYMVPKTYGHVICDGTSVINSKYSMGAQTMQGNFTVQNSGVYQPGLAGGLTIHGNTLIQSSGNFDATRSGAVMPITHTLNGNYTNNATFTAAATYNSTMQFTSTTANQQIGGTSITTFYNLTINNTSGLGVTLTQDENVSNVWTLTNGAFFLNSRRLTLTNAATTAMVRTNGYAVSEQTGNLSKIQWNMNTTTGAHIFPFGTSGGTYIPFTFNLTAGTIGNVTVSTYNTPATNLPWPSAPDIVTNLNSTTGLLPDNRNATVDRFWQIDKTGVSGTATMTFSYATAELPIAPYNVVSDQRAQRYSTTTNQWQTALGGQTTGSITGGYTVTVPGVTTFSPWAIASQLSPLPIELVNFDASFNGKNVDVTWETSSETNSDYFIVEKTVDGINFDFVAMVDAAGNSSHNLKYSSIDYSPKNGISYYRLKQVDINGTFKYTNLKEINVAIIDETSFIAFPNPALDYIDINFVSSAETNVTISVFDVTGKLVLSKSFYAASGSNSDKINITEIESGIYFICLKTPTAVVNKRIIIN